LFKSQGVSNANLLTDPDTSSTKDTKVIIPVVEWIIFFHPEIAIIDGVVNLFHTQFLNQVLQFTLTILRTIPASSGHTSLPDSAHVFFAFILFFTYQAA